MTLLDRLSGLLNLRSLVLVVGVWLAVVPPANPVLQSLDDALFSSANVLSVKGSRFDSPPGVWSRPPYQQWWLKRLGGRGSANTSPFRDNEGVTAQYQTPWWFYPAHSLLVLVLAVYLVGLVPRLRLSVALLLTLLISVVLIASQLGAAIARAHWLPMGLAGQYLWFGLLLMGCWHRNTQWVRRYQGVSQELSELKLQQGDWRGASDALAECPPTADVLTRLYEQAREHENKHRYTEALRIYRLLQKRRRRYRDVTNRLATLEQAGTGKASSNGDMAQTLVLENPQPRQLGRYDIERELGRGAMGIVYLGHDPHIARDLAVKTLHYGHLEAGERESVKARFFREAKAAGRLRHPQIVSVYDVGEEAELAYIVMDYVEGESLSRYTQKNKLLPVARVYRLVAQVADALAYAHGQDIVHRDIKPGNILYSSDNHRVTVTDFGIARIASSARTQTGEIFGSPLYMSPEQIKGQRVGQASDIFSLGVTLYQLLSGALPFKGDNIAELSYHIVQGRHKNIRDLRPQLPRSATRIINKALQKDPQKRYASAADMARTLNKALERDFNG